MTRQEFDHKKVSEAWGDRVVKGNDPFPLELEWLAEWVKCPNCKGKGEYSCNIVPCNKGRIFSPNLEPHIHYCRDCDGSRHRGKIQRLMLPKFWVETD